MATISSLSPKLMSPQVKPTASTVPNMRTWRKIILRDTLTTFHILVLAAAVLLLVMISIDTLQNKSFLTDSNYIHLQFWICLLFLFDIVLEMCTGTHRWYYYVAHVFFLLVCIPYLNIVHYLGIQVEGHLAFILRIIPMIRVAYVMAMVLTTFSTNRVKSMFGGYVALLIMVVYFGSLLFFVEEHAVNPDIHSYWSALWWAWMNMTTAGCNINEYTLTGKVLSVVLSGGGLILFPVFTVYIAAAVAGPKSQNND